MLNMSLSLIGKRRETLIVFLRSIIDDLENNKLNLWESESRHKKSLSRLHP